MSFWDLLNLNKVSEEKIANAVASGEIPKIKSSEELEIYLKYKIEDAAFAKIFTQILDKIGHDGAIEIKKGGDGDPYRVEYVPSRLRKMMAKKEIKKRKKDIFEILDKDSSLSDVEIQKYQEELAQLSDVHAIIWVNLKNNKDFTLKENMLTEALNATTKALKMK